MYVATAFEFLSHVPGPVIYARDQIVTTPDGWYIWSWFDANDLDRTYWEESHEPAILRLLSEAAAIAREAGHTGHVIFVPKQIRVSMGGTPRAEGAYGWDSTLAPVGLVPTRLWADYQEAWRVYRQRRESLAAVHEMVGTQAREAGHPHPRAAADAARPAHADRAELEALERRAEALERELRGVLVAA